jgi:hypothetical protein
MTASTIDVPVLERFSDSGTFIWYSGDTKRPVAKPHGLSN